MIDDMEKDVPYIVYESEAARHERTVKRLIVAIVLIVLLLVGTNMAWLYVFNQYDFSSTTTEITTDEGNTNLLEAGANANGGVINNGNNSEDSSKDGD